MAESPKIKRPTGLKAKGRKLWDTILDVYELGPHELSILEDACRETDLVDRLERELKDAPMVVPGSMGQDVVHPLVQEVRQHRATKAQLITKLALPDEDGAGSRSAAGRDLAAARWRRSA